MGMFGMLLIFIGLGWIGYRLTYGKPSGSIGTVTPYIILFIGLMSVSLGSENQDVQSKSSNIFIAFVSTYILVLLIFLFESWLWGVLSRSHWIWIGIGIVLFVIAISL